MANPGSGRPPGRLNNATVEAKAFANRILDPAWEETVRQRMALGTLPPQIEVLLLHYKFGKPKEHVELSSPDGGALKIEIVREITK